MFQRVTTCMLVLLFIKIINILQDVKSNIKDTKVIYILLDGK